MVLQQKIAERTKLLSQLEQAKMQEQVSASLRSMSELAAPGNTPSLDEVRDKIERRYANAIGSAELAQSSVQGRMLEVEQAGVQMAGHSRLEQIRASMRGEALPAGGSAAPGDSRDRGDPGVGYREAVRPAVAADGRDGGDSRVSAGAGARCCGSSAVSIPPPSCPTWLPKRSAPQPIRAPGCCAGAAGRCGGR